MAKFLLALAALVLLLAGAVFFRSLSAPTAPAGQVDVRSLQEGDSSAGGSATASAGASIAALSSAAETTAPSVRPIAPSGGSRVDHGAATSVPATTTFVGPDGEVHDIPPANPELVALGDIHLRAAVMDEIRSDPEAFAQAMGVELQDVQRVADGQSELPPQWIAQ